MKDFIYIAVVGCLFALCIPFLLKTERPEEPIDKGIPVDTMYNDTTHWIIQDSGGLK